MANARSLSASAATAASAAPAAATTTARTHSPNRRLRAVDRDDVVRLTDMADFLPPGATWLPAPQHSLPTLPGRPPMIGYLVLVPADQQAALAGAFPDARPFAAGALPQGVLAPQAVVREAPAASATDGPVLIDSTRRIATVDGVALDLTYLEFELLAHLVAHPHRVHTRDQLVTTVWGYGHVGDGRTVDVHVARLRRKLGAQYRHSIQTVRRVGYKYAP